ncbi:hypothetical protein PPERSA_00596 [Pseudocohnilembus persalinus]|uniref:gamma-glutamylcyclotransferase n=1 Tax=Pseudocohnilembus persalinus TaxID=266149 RepID=A0A0V0QSM2_PSEPJ|nr:hypothetical protein PPERSA_00596 [Pseudocohnilembus persalinus]|eukprot:KRX05295.1 hypothetical protein PPERSA_00596 [Pseudocohnilembus persalinus]
MKGQKYFILVIFIVLILAVNQFQAFNFGIFGNSEKEESNIAEKTVNKIGKFADFQHKKFYQLFMKTLKNSLKDYKTNIKNMDKNNGDVKTQNDEKYYYFAFGSNMNKNRMIERDCQFVNRQLGILPGYKLDFSKRSTKKEGTSYANIREKEGSTVEGALYELKDHDQILKLDKFEGHPTMYKRHEKTVYLDKELKNSVKAYVYIAEKDFITENLKPEKWYLDHLLFGKDLISKDYLQTLLDAVTYDDFVELNEQL